MIRSLNWNKRTVAFACEVEVAKSIKHISKNSPKPVSTIFIQNLEIWNHRQYCFGWSSAVCCGRYSSQEGINRLHHLSLSDFLLSISVFLVAFLVLWWAHQWENKVLLLLSLPHWASPRDFCFQCDYNVPTPTPWKGAKMPLILFGRFANSSALGCRGQTIPSGGWWW